MPKKLQKPAYQLHSGSGQARVKIEGKDHYLGAYGSPDSREKYDNLIAEWLARQDVSRVTLLIDDLCLLFLDYAESYYRHKDGTPTGEANNMRHALRFLVQTYGRCRIREFGPVKLKKVRQAMINAGMCRTNINRTIHRVKRVFAWVVENEYVPPSVYQALTALSSLRAGRTEAKESEPVRPVEECVVHDTLPFLSRVVADMVRLQLLTGMRPGEVCALRPCDVTHGSDSAWIYRPERHKTEHHGKERRIFIGPEGQKILTPYLNRDADSYCFSPVDAEHARNKEKKQNRRSPMTPSQAARKPQGRNLKNRYTKDSYRRSVERGCEKAFKMPTHLRNIDSTIFQSVGLHAKEQADLKMRLQVEAAEWRQKHCWSPNQLRHSRATAIRERYGTRRLKSCWGTRIRK